MKIADNAWISMTRCIVSKEELKSNKIGNWVPTGEVTYFSTIKNFIKRK